MEKSFSMSKYANETDLYKAKAEYFESKYSELLSTLSDEVGELVHYCDTVRTILIENGYPGKAEALKNRYMKVYKLLDLKF